MEVGLHFLNGRKTGGYVTWGVPWKKGDVHKGDVFSVTDENGNMPAVDTEPCAYWPDGSLKWTSHTAKIGTRNFVLSKSENTPAPDILVNIRETDNAVMVNNGVLEMEFPKSGVVLMRSTAGEVTLKAVKEERSIEDGVAVKREISYIGEIEVCRVERHTAQRAVIKCSSRHKRADGSGFIRFIVRFYIYAGEKSVRIMHTFLYDGDAQKDFLKGAAVCIERRLYAKQYNRRVKIAGEYGIMHEPAILLTAWKPRLDGEIYKAQLAGKNVELDENDETVREALDDIAVWDCYKLVQETADSFVVKKKTAGEKCSYIKAGNGSRSKGLMYIGDGNKGIGVCMRNFHKKYPSELEVCGVSGEKCTLTAWIVPEDMPALDFRHYDTKAHSKTYYEGFNEIRSTPYGIANTNELTLFVFDNVPSDEELMKLADETEKPAVVAAEPEYYHSVGAFGKWGLVNRECGINNWLEDELEKAFEFYKNEVEQRRWYGLMDYGDVMHTYDGERHCWKYDMGGYAWQNTELVPTLWLWYYFMRTGREDVFTMAEAMSRHTSEVDIYHFGKFKGLGSRHNVVHWGDACKEPRISMAGHHRFLYYMLGGDDRLKDIFEDVRDADYSTLEIDPLRFFYNKEDMKMPTHARTGPDWASYCSNWFTWSEITGDFTYMDKIKTGLSDIKKSPMRMISGSNYEYDPRTGHLGYIGESAAGGSHLAICMGEPQFWFELADCMEDEELKCMLVEYGRFYYLPPEEKERESGGLISSNGWSFPYMAAALAAYSARYGDNEALAGKVWDTLITELKKEDGRGGFNISTVRDYYNAPEIQEIKGVSTNFTSQWCLNVITSLELIGNKLANSEK